ncbi:hypothetical protein AB9K24_08540 [Meridianimaribacter flavus]
MSTQSKANPSESPLNDLIKFVGLFALIAAIYNIGKQIDNKTKANILTDRGKEVLEDDLKSRKLRDEIKSSN